MPLHGAGSRSPLCFAPAIAVGLVHLAWSCGRVFVCSCVRIFFCSTRQPCLEGQAAWRRDCVSTCRTRVDLNRMPDKPRLSQ